MVNSISQFNFISTAQPLSQFQEATNLMNKQMPMNPLGNREVEQAIVKEESEQKRVKETLDFSRQMSNVHNGGATKTDISNLPYSHFMQQLDLKPTGNKNQDYENIMEELDFQIENAESEYDADYYKWFKRQVVELFSKFKEENATPYNCFTGAEQLAGINMLSVYR